MTDCRKANQGKKSHKDVESILIHYFNTYTHITATKAKPFSNKRLQQPADHATLSFVRLLRWGELGRWYAMAGEQRRISSLSSLLVGNNPSGRHVAREPLEMSSGLRELS